MSRPTNGLWRAFLALLLGIGLACLLLLSFDLAWAQEPDDRPVNLDVILLIDNSMSMSLGNEATGAPPSDPDGLRIQAAKFLVDYLCANAETARANYRTGIVSFGGVISDVIPLRLTQDEAVREGIKAEQIERTDFRAPLEFALREFRAKSFGTGNRMAIILFTDGRPHLTEVALTDQELEDYFNDLMPLVSDLREGGVSLYVLGIGDARKDREDWTGLIPEEHYFPITSTRQLVTIYHRIVTELIGVAAHEAGIVPPGQRVSVDVQPYLEYILFSFVKSDPGISITLRAPSGRSFEPVTETAEYHAIYSFSYPEPGEWTVQWDGEGDVRYWVDRQYPLLQVRSEKPSYRVREPITIAASLSRDGVTVTGPLNLEAGMALRSGYTRTQVISHTGGGTYRGSYPGLPDAGWYTITARAFVDGEPLTTRSQPVVVSVLAPPAATATTTPSATPPAAVGSEATPTAPLPTMTPGPTEPGEGTGFLKPVVSAIEQHRGSIVRWTVIVLGSVLLALVLWLLLRWAWRRVGPRIEDGILAALDKVPGKPTELVSWIGRVQGVSAPEEALVEFLLGLEAEKKKLEPMKETAVRKARLGAIALYQRCRSRGEPTEVVFEALAQGAADGTDSIREGVAEALVHILTAQGDDRLLESHLYFAREASEHGLATDEISDTLHKAATYASERARDALRRVRRDGIGEWERAELLRESQRYDFISCLLGTYASLWSRRNTHIVDIGELFRQAGALLENPLVQGAAFRDELHRLYHGLYDMLGDIQFSEDAVPLHLSSIPAGEPDRAEELLRMALGGYEAQGIAAVLKYLVNQPLYPVTRFMEQLDEAEEALEEQVSVGNLLVPDEVILRFLFDRWRDAAKSDLEHRRAALSLDLVSDQAYSRMGGRETTIRVAAHNVAQRARIGQAEDVSISVEPPLTGYTVDPVLGFISLILPWETDVTYDLVVQFPDSLTAGKVNIPLKLEFSDLAEGRTSRASTVEVELLDPGRVPDGITYDPLTAAEIRRLTGGRDELRELIERTVADAHPDARVLHLEDLEEVVTELVDAPQLGNHLGWAELSQDEKAALHALIELLGSGPRAHVRAVEIRRHLMDAHPGRLVNWNRVIRELTRKGFLQEKDGLYAVGVGLLRRWMVDQGVRVGVG